MKLKLNSMIRIIPTFFLMLLCINSAWGQQKKEAGTPTVQGMWWSEFNETLKHDASGCYWEVTFEWGCAQNNTTQFNLWMLPHGIRITVSGSTINGTPTISGSSWTNTFTPLSGIEAEWTNIPTDPNDPYSCPNTGTSILPLSVIPYSSLITIKIYVLPTSGSHNITVKSLGWTGTNFQATSTDTPPIPVSPPLSPPEARPQDYSICKGEDTVVDLIDPVPSPAKIKWYKYEPNCTGPCIPPTMPLSQDPNWVEVNPNPPQVGVNSIATNGLDQTTCYVAVIEDGCFSYLSTVARVEVCEPLTNISISPTEGSDSLQNINGENRACGRWTGGLVLNYTNCCRMKPASWTLSTNDANPEPVFDIENLSLSAPNNTDSCFNKYTFTATDSNACGDIPVSFTIYVDREITPDDITLTGNVWDLPTTVLTPLGPICYEQSARINTEKNCDEIEIVEWQEMKWTPVGNPNGTWVTNQGALGTSLYHTNKLRNPGPGIRSAWYRVGITNGACDTLWSNSYEIQVKPVLTVSLTPVSGRLCPPTTSITLTATPSYTTDVMYQWYWNGDLISGSNNEITATQPGEYYVVVSDNECHKTAKSDVITICSEPEVVIEGPCVVCKDTEFKLNALVLSEPEGCTSDCTTFLWSTVDGHIITSVNAQTIKADKPGTYVVTVTCGSCVVTTRQIVTSCPPITSDCICDNWLPVMVSFGGNDLVVPIGGTVTGVFVGSQVTVNAKIICKPKGCKPSTYSWDINPGNLSGTNIPFTFTASVLGSYVVRLHAVCGSQKCDDSIIVATKPRLKQWRFLIEEGVLTGENDPVNLALNDGRQKLAETAFGASIEKWYADLNQKDWISVMLVKYPSEVKSLLGVGRKLIDRNGTMDKSDLDIIEKVMRIMDKEISPAPAGMIDESLKRFRSSIGKNWNQVLENLTK